MANIISWGITDGYRVAQTVGKELGNPTSCTLEEFIAAAERAKIKSPNEWVIYYVLADKYQELGKYTDALLAAQKCVEIRPKDIRSVYALATSYNLITRAAYSDNEEEALSLVNLFWGSNDQIDKRFSQEALDRTRLTIETAAVQAIRWFENALTLSPDSQSMTQIQMDLQTLYKRFPHLKR